MGPTRVRVFLLLLLVLFSAVNNVHTEDLSLTDLEKSIDTYNLRTSVPSNEDAAVGPTEDIAVNRKQSEVDLNTSSDQGGNNNRRNAAYNPQTEIEPDSQLSADRSGQLTPQPIVLNSPSEVEAFSQLFLERSGHTNKLAEVISETETDQQLKSGKPNLRSIPYSLPSEIERELQHSSDRSGQLSPQTTEYNSPSGTAGFPQPSLDRSSQPSKLEIEKRLHQASDRSGQLSPLNIVHSPLSEIEGFPQVSLDRSGQPVAYSPLSETEADPQLMSEKPNRRAIAYSSPSESERELQQSSDRSGQLTPQTTEHNSPSEAATFPQPLLDRSGQPSKLEIEKHLHQSSDRSGQLSPLNVVHSPSSEIEGLPQVSLDRSGQPVAYNPLSETEADPQLMSGKPTRRAIAYNSPSETERELQQSSDRSGQLSPVTIVHSPASEVEGFPQLSLDRSVQPNKLEIETDLQQLSDRSGQQNPLTILHSPSSEIEGFPQVSFDRSGQHSKLFIEADPQLRNGKPHPFMIAYNPPSEIEGASQLSLDRSGQRNNLADTYSLTSEFEVNPQLRSGKPDPFMIAYNPPSEIERGPQLSYDRSAQPNNIADTYSLTSEIEVDPQLKSGQPSPITIAYSPQGEGKDDINLRSDHNSQPSKLSIAYSPNTEIETDPQFSLDRSSQDSEIETFKRASPIQQDESNSDARKYYPKDFISKLKLALTTDDYISNLPTFRRRHIPRNEHIKLNEISGASALIQCSSEGEFYSVMTPWNQCILCVCVGNHIPQPVCVNCAECRDTGLKVPLSAITSAAIGEALLAPTRLPFLPKRPIKTEFTTIDTDKTFKTLQPNVVPQQILPKEIARGKVPRSCSPLPNGQPFAHPLNPCQTCVCHTTTGDVQITCRDNSQCVLLPEQHANTAIPPANEPIPAPQCANMPPNVLFPHPTDRCKKCQCFEQVSSFDTRAPQLYCVSIPGCEIAATSQYSTPVEENIVVIPKVSTTIPAAFQTPLYTSDVSKPPHFFKPGLMTPTIMAPSLTQSLPASPDYGLVSPQATLLPHFNPPLTSEEPDYHAVAAVNEKIPELQKTLEHQNPSEKPLPWPPKSVPALPQRTNGPLLGPPPHESCQPYPPNTMFQHPWDECQVCRCSEHHTIGHTSIEVNCFTKPSCCIELPQLISENENLQFGRPQDLGERDQISTLTIPVNGALQPPMMNDPAEAFMVSAPEVAEISPEGQYGLPIAKQVNHLYQYPSPSPPTPAQLFKYPSTQHHYPQLPSKQYQQNTPIKTYATPLPYYHQGFTGQNHLLNPQEKLLMGYQQQSNSLGLQSRYPNNFAGQSQYLTNGFGNTNNVMWPNSFKPNYAHAQAHVKAMNQARADQAWVQAAQARSKTTQRGRFQSRGIFENYRQDLTHDQPLEREAESNASNSYSYSNDVYSANMYPNSVYPTNAYPTNTYPTNLYSTNAYSTNAYPTNVYPTANEYPNSADFLHHSTTDPYGRSDVGTAIQNEQVPKDVAGTLSHGEVEPVTRGGRGQCQYVGDMYLHQCQTCRCLADPHRPGELYSLCSGTPCR